MLRVAILTSILALSACVAGPTPYQPAGDARYGYSEQRLQSDRYRVSFSGNELTEKDTVQNYLLFRAAELTLADGYRYFRFFDEQVERIEEGDDQAVIVAVGNGIYTYPVILGTQLGTDNTSRRYQASAQFRMLTEQPVPSDSPSDADFVFDAREVKRNLGPNVRLPEDDAS